MHLKTYTPRERNMYMTGLFGQNILFNVAAAFTGYYMQSVLFIPVAITGVVLVLAQVWDAFNDPIMGTIVDKTRTKWGKCRPYLLFVPIITSAMLMICFLCVPYDNAAGLMSPHNIMVILWAGGFYILWGMSYTAGDIPLWGISALLTEDEKHRRSLQAAARVAAGVGAAIAMVGFQQVAISVGGVLRTRGVADADRKGFIIMAAVFIAFGFATFQMAGLFTREKIAPSKKKNKVGENFKMMWKNKPFRQVLVSGVLAAPRNLTNIVALTLVTYYFAGKNGAVGMLYLVMIGGGTFGGMFVASALTPKLLTKFTKRNLYIYSNLLEVIPDVLMFVLYLISIHVEGGLTAISLLIPAIICFTVKGVSMGLYSTVQTALISDAVDYEDFTNHIRPDAVFFSGQTFIVKIGNGLSQILYAALCGIVLFSGKNVELLQGLLDKAGSNIDLLPRNLMELGSNSVVFSNSLGSLTADHLYWIMFMLFFAITILPAIGSVLTIIPMIKYELTPEKYEVCLKTIQQRRRDEGEIIE